MKKENSYNKIEDIPPHIFKDKALRIPASKELHQYLQFMVKNYPDDLDYLWLKSQQYVDHGGHFRENFKTWLTKLQNSLDRIKGTYE